MCGYGRYSLMAIRLHSALSLDNLKHLLHTKQYASYSPEPRFCSFIASQFETTVVASYSLPLFVPMC